MKIVISYKYYLSSNESYDDDEVIKNYNIVIIKINN